MDGKRLIHSIAVTNLLSFGGVRQELALEPLNVLIGPNASGKSNLIEVIRVLAASATDLTAPFRSGGIREWLWKEGGQSPVAEIAAKIEDPRSKIPLRHYLSLTASGQRMQLVDETIERSAPLAGQKEPAFFYTFKGGTAALRSHSKKKESPPIRILLREELAPDQSILSQRKDPEQYPEMSYLGSQYGQIRVYSDWSFGRSSGPRLPQKTDLPEDSLDETCSNLGLVLNELQHNDEARTRVQVALKKFCPRFEDWSVKIHAGTVQLFLREKGLGPIPATRLSDGTLRYLCLLAVLCHPTPPPLVCIEEPELGLHPDALPVLGEILVEASQRMQLIVTTHSDVLVSALTDYPEAVVVCERTDKGTTLRRLAREPLEAWLKKYSLGTLWTMGEIGGTSE